MNNEMNEMPAAIIAAITRKASTDARRDGWTPDAQPTRRAGWTDAAWAIYAAAYLAEMAAIDAGY